MCVVFIFRLSGARTHARARARASALVPLVSFFEKGHQQVGVTESRGPSGERCTPGMRRAEREQHQIPAAHATCRSRSGSVPWCPKVPPPHPNFRIGSCLTRPRRAPRRDETARCCSQRLPWPCVRHALPCLWLRVSRPQHRLPSIHHAPSILASDWRPLLAPPAGSRAQTASAMRERTSALPRFRRSRTHWSCRCVMASR